MAEVPPVMVPNVPKLFDTPKTAGSEEGAACDKKLIENREDLSHPLAAAMVVQSMKTKMMEARKAAAKFPKICRPNIFEGSENSEKEDIPATIDLLEKRLQTAERGGKAGAVEHWGHLLIGLQEYLDLKDDLEPLPRPGLFYKRLELSQEARQNPHQERAQSIAQSFRRVHQQGKARRPENNSTINSQSTGKAGLETRENARPPPPREFVQQDYSRFVSPPQSKETDHEGRFRFSSPSRSSPPYRNYDNGPRNSPLPSGANRQCYDRPPFSETSREHQQGRQQNEWDPTTSAREFGNGVDDSRGRSFSRRSISPRSYVNNEQLDYPQYSGRNGFARDDHHNRPQSPRELNHQSRPQEDSWHSPSIVRDSGNGVDHLRRQSPPRGSFPPQYENYDNNNPRDYSAPSGGNGSFYNGNDRPPLFENRRETWHSPPFGRDSGNGVDHLRRQSPPRGSFPPHYENYDNNNSRDYSAPSGGNGNGRPPLFETRRETWHSPPLVRNSGNEVDHLRRQSPPRGHFPPCYENYDNNNPLDFAVISEMNDRYSLGELLELRREIIQQNLQPAGTWHSPLFDLRRQSPPRGPFPPYYDNNNPRDYSSPLGRNDGYNRQQGQNEPWRQPPSGSRQFSQPIFANPPSDYEAWVPPPRFQGRSTDTSRLEKPQQCHHVEPNPFFYRQ